MGWSRYTSRLRPNQQQHTPTADHQHQHHLHQPQQQQPAQPSRTPTPTPPPIPPEIHIGPTSAPRAIAKRHFGSATVTCCIRGAHSKWGKHQAQNAAILHFMFSASQPPEFKLGVFQVRAEFLTKTTEGEGGSGVSGQTAVVVVDDSELCLLDQPSPKWVGGDQTTRKLVTGFTAEPKAEGGGVSVGLGNRTKSEEREVLRSWTFSSGWDSDHQGNYNVASWIWVANTDNPQVDDRGALYGALALRYPSMQPFYLCSSVEGKLVKERSLNIFRLVPRREIPEQPYTVRLTPVSSNEDLEDEVKKLEEHVVQLNLQPAARLGRA